MTFSVDKEVQDFGPYKLVIRQPKGARAYSVLWRGGEKLAYAEAESREAAFNEMLRLLGIRQLELAQAQGNKPLSAEQVATTFRYLWGFLTRAQQRMLQALHRAPQREMTVPALAEVVGFRGHSGVNLWLGLAGAMFANECPRAEGEMLYREDGTPVMTSWFALWDDPRSVWTMRPEVADGMRQAECIAS
jgi:hypothetical protein